MSNDKLTFVINKYIRSNDPQSVSNITEALVKLVVRNFDKQTVDKLVKIMAESINTRKLYITVSHKVPRSRSQEGYYRKWSRGFAEFCGMTPDEMHNEMLLQTFGTIEVETKFGWRKRPNKRSNNTTKQEFSSLIETLIRTAAEMGFDIPPAHREEDDKEG
jgi:hypothetical protein|tara:strand:+ start:319 stop:801 length:483 start_codon:yes stop_codon:yes gene_type:complete